MLDMLSEANEMLEIAQKKDRLPEVESKPIDRHQQFATILRERLFGTKKITT